MSAAAGKRPVGSGEDGADRRRARQRRLDISEARCHGETCSSASTSTAASTSSTGGIRSSAAIAAIDIDLICNIASYMDIGSDLTNLCVAVGRAADAAKIRTEYLRDNDEYVQASLEIIPPHQAAHFIRFRDNLHLFNKCRDNILAWMRVNTDWRDRCTDENMERYRGTPLRIEANLVFNNPAVAIEVGLLEVFRFLVEEKNVDVSSDVWNGYSSNEVDRDIEFLIFLALVRGDVGILTYLMSVDGFDFTRMNENANAAGTLPVSVGYDVAFATVVFAFSVDMVEEDCYKAFIRHPKVNNVNVVVNAVGPDGGSTPLGRAIRSMSIDMRESRHARRIMCLLEAGANPLAFDSTWRCSLMEYAIMQQPLNPWPSIVDKMEEMITTFEHKDTFSYIGD